jgi:hypothetical protein
VPLNNGRVSLSSRFFVIPLLLAATMASDSTYVLLLRLRYDLFLKMTDTAQSQIAAGDSAAFDGHSTYWHHLRDVGKAPVAAAMGGKYWDNVAFIIFQAPSLAEAERTMHGDPAIKAHVFEGQVRPITVFWPKPPKS